MVYALILSNVGVLYTQLDKFMIKSNIGTTEVGYYYMAQRIINMVNILMLTLVTVTMPRLSNYLGRNLKDEYLILLKRIVKIYFLILFPASIGLVCLSREVIDIFGGNEYLAVVPVMMVFSIYMLSLGIQNIISNQIIYLYQKEKEDSILTLIGGIINLILNMTLVFTGKFTVVTAISTTLIANLILIGLQYRLVRKVIKFNINLFEFENTKYFLYSLGFIPIKILVKSFVENITYICIIDIILCIIFYLIILIYTKDEILFEVIDRILKKLALLYK